MGMHASAYGGIKKIYICLSLTLRAKQRMSDCVDLLLSSGSVPVYFLSKRENAKVLNAGKVRESQSGACNGSKIQEVR